MSSPFNLKILDYITNRNLKRKEFSEKGARIKIENKNNEYLQIEIYEEYSKPIIIIHKGNENTGEFKKVYSGDFWQVPISTVQEERRNPHREHNEDSPSELQESEPEVEILEEEQQYQRVSTQAFAQQGQAQGQVPIGLIRLNTNTVTEEESETGF